MKFKSKGLGYKFYGKEAPIKDVTPIELRELHKLWNTFQVWGHIDKKPKLFNFVVKPESYKESRGIESGEIDYIINLVKGEIK